MSAQPKESKAIGDWNVREAEKLIESLTGVLSSRIVTDRSGDIQEVHVLTDEEVAPKQTVRNVESALLARLDIPIDHRKISVAQTDRPPRAPGGPEGTMSLVVERAAPPRPDGRILYVSHRTETQSSNRSVVTVTVEYKGDTYQGEAVAADLLRARLEAAANATLRAIEATASGIQGNGEDPSPMVALALDGVRLIEAFDRKYVLTAVHALAGRDIIALSGSAVVDDRIEASVIMATLQATDRWVRGRLD